MRLELELEKRQGDFRLEVGFAVEGDRIGLFGPSGSGRSTLVGLLAGLSSPDRGHIRLDGETLVDTAAGLHLAPERRRIGLVMQGAHLFPHLSVAQNLRYGWRRTPKALRRIDPDELARVLDIAHLQGRGVTTLSGGEKQRVALGRALLACPRLLLLDEPLTGLDAALKQQIIPYLRRVFTAFGIPYLYISHEVMEMRLMTEQVLVFEAGRLAHQGSAEDLARRRLAKGEGGYVNLLALSGPRPVGTLTAYRWGAGELLLPLANAPDSGLFELSAKDILLCKRHPEAFSARNLLACTVAGLQRVGDRVAVELACGDGRLIAQVVPEAVAELDLAPGRPVFAVFKASAFRQAC